MLFTEEELAVQVGCLDVIGVGDRDLAISADIEHCEILQQLATNCAASDHEELQGFEFIGKF
jgi:hypothetical protein